MITGWFQTNEITGEFDIQCAEICGVGHGLMPARIYIETPEQHASWMADNQAVTLAALDVPQTVKE